MIAAADGDIGDSDVTSAVVGGAGGPFGPGCRGTPAPVLRELHADVIA
jgi:hypothetical protein